MHRRWQISTLAIYALVQVLVSEAGGSAGGSWAGWTPGSGPVYITLFHIENVFYKYIMYFWTSTSCILLFKVLKNIPVLHTTIGFAPFATVGFEHDLAVAFASFMAQARFSSVVPLPPGSPQGFNLSGAGRSLGTTGGTWSTLRRPRTGRRLTSTASSG